MLYYGLIYPLIWYGIVVWGHSAEVLTRRIFVLQKRAVRYIAGLKHLESCKDSFRNLPIVTVYSLYVQETILYNKKCNCTVNKQIHLTQEITKTIIFLYGHNLELYNREPSVAGCIFYNKLYDNIKQIQNKIQFTRELKKLLIKGYYYTVEDYLNEEFSNIGYWYKQKYIMYKILYI
jgi:hypothetical protein